MTETTDDPAFESLLEYLRAARGVDLTGYKRSSLRRRVAKRMHELDLPDAAALQDHLEVHPDEFQRLLDTILINVTGFFRDPDAWAYLAEEVIPQLTRGSSSDRPIRVWSAGCASGEEAYTLAMLFAEALGEDQVRDRVKVYATDIDEDALVTARAAVYGRESVEAIPEALRARYLEPVGGRFQIRPDLRRCVIFGRHDLVRDAPISRLDLLVCRNVLMYFNRDTQAQVLNRLHFALRRGGLLFLGRAEMLLTRTDLFEPVNLRHRVFRPAAAAVPIPLAGRPPTDAEGTVSMARLRDALFEAGPTAQLGLTVDGVVAMVNDRCRTMFGLQEHDVGRPLRDLELSYRPIDLRTHVDQVLDERRPIQLRAIERRVAEVAPQYLDILISPLLDGSDLVGVSVSFTDITHFENLRSRLHRAHQDLETSYEELQSTNEELETTNEELQSANEELETTNEELQSANEELETMNEELQSANAQQAEVGAELSSRSAALDELNTFLEGILTSLRSAVVVVDRDFAVRIWNHQAFEDWGLRADEVVGRSLMNLDVGLPVTELAAAIREALDGRGTTLDVDAITRRGRPATAHVTVSPLADTAAGSTGAVLLVEVDATTTAVGGDG